MPGRPERRLPRPTRLLLAAILVLNGCEVGPDFHRPAAPTARYQQAPLPSRIAGADTLGGQAQALTVGQAISGQWWTLFHSPELTALIDLGLRNNPNLAAAQATLLQARETARADAGALFPSLSAGLGVSHQRVSSQGFGGVSSGVTSSTGGSGSGSATGTSGSNGGVGTTTVATAASVYDLYNASVNVSYALDIWGGTRRSVEEAEAQANYEQYVLEATYLTLTANIVTAAVTEASLAAQIDGTRQVVKAEQNGLRLVSAQLAAGAVTRADLLQQQAQLQATLATLPPLELQRAQEANLLATYVGAYPSDFTDPNFDLTELTLPGELPVSVPSALVAQRPDIRQSEAQLHEATAEVGVTTAALLPQVTLTGSYGSDALKVAQLFSAGGMVYTLAAQLTQQLFEGGTLVHKRRAAIAGMQAAAGQYQATVIAAFANVSDALLALQYDATGLQVALAAATAARGSLELLQAQFAAGAVNQLSVLNAEQTAQNASITLARAQAARYADTVALFQALGGGWWNRDDISPKVAKCCHLFQ